MKLYAYSKKKVQGNLAVGVIALVLALLSAVFGPVLQCIFAVLSLFISAGAPVSLVLKKNKKSEISDVVFVLLAVLITFFAESFSAAAIAMAIYKLSEAALVYIAGSLGKDMKKAADIVPAYANIHTLEGGFERIATKALAGGMLVLVKSGETVPADCILKEGVASFDTRALYADGGSVLAEPGDFVYAGYKNTGSDVVLEVVRAEHSIANDLKRIAITGEKSSKAGSKRFYAVSAWYPAAMVFLAIVVLFLFGVYGPSWGSAMKRCALLLICATGGSYVSLVSLLNACGVWRLKRDGLSIDNCEEIEILSELDCVAFEKSGVLTDSNYVLKEIYAADKMSEADVLMLIANCIGGKTHPISRLVEANRNPHIIVENAMEFAGKGIECTILEKTFLCGSEVFLKECGIEIGEQTGYTVYVAADGVLVGAVKIENLLKQGTSDQLQALREVGVLKTVLLTSEAKETAEAAYLSCGADEYRFDLTAQGRADAISELKENDHEVCAYVGDARYIQAITKADIGISVVNTEEGVTAKQGAVLLGDMKTLANAVEIARETVGKIELHFYAATAVKLILVLLSLFGAISLGGAIIIDALLSASAILSAKSLLK